MSEAGLRVETSALRAWLHSGDAALAGLLVATGLLVLPPLGFLIGASFTPDETGAPALANYAAVVQSGAGPWVVTFVYAAGSAVLAILLGVPCAWMSARSDAPFRALALVAAFLSLAVPALIKGIGWIMLLGPNSGLLNLLLRSVLGGDEGPIQPYSLGGMIAIEGVVAAPLVYLLMLPAFSSADPALEEAAAISGANLSATLRLVTLPLALPSVLACFLFVFVDALQSFEVPLLLGIPGGQFTVTAIIYQSMNAELLPRYGEVSAFAVLLLVLIVGPLVMFYRIVGRIGRFATVTGKAFRPRRVALGAWRYPLGLWMLIIPASLMAPLAVMMWASFMPIYQPSAFADLSAMSVANYAAVWSRGDLVNGLANSIAVAVYSACAVSALTFAIAWLVIRHISPLRFMLDACASLPLVVPGLVAGIAFLIQFLNLTFLPVYGTQWILVLAFTFRFLPYGLRFCHAGILAIHRDLEESGRVSGGSLSAVLLRIVLPLALPAVVAAWLFVFLHTVRDLSISAILSGPDNPMISVVILDLWNNGELPVLAALSTALAVCMTLIGLVFMRLSFRVSGLNAK